MKSNSEEKQFVCMNTFNDFKNETNEKINKLSDKIDESSKTQDKIMEKIEKVSDKMEHITDIFEIGFENVKERLDSSEITNRCHFYNT